MGKFKKFFFKYWYLLILALIILFFGVWGFCESPLDTLYVGYEIKYKWLDFIIKLFDSIYNIIRIILFHHEFHEINWQLEICRWAAVFFFILTGGHIVLNIKKIPIFLKKRRIKKFRNHIVIFGKDEICVELIRKIRRREKETQNKPTQIVYIVDKDLKMEEVENYENENLKIIEGNPLENNKTNNSILKTANILKASKFFAVCEDDNKNIEIAKNVWSYLTDDLEIKKRIEKKKADFKSGKEVDTESILKSENETALRCYTLVKNNDLKNILEETPIFKYERKKDEVFYFDGVVFNLNSVGIQYGINMEIENILPKLDVQPNILIVGLNNSAISVMLHLSHILTLNGKQIQFHIIENDEKLKTNFFKKYHYLFDFAKFDFYNINNFDYQYFYFSSIFICNEQSDEAIKKAVEIRNKLQKDEPTIFIITNNSEYIKQVFNPTTNTENKEKILTFEGHNIKVFNRLEYFWDLIIERREEIEKNARKLHEDWYNRKKINYEGVEIYDYLTETLKQSNRNAALDFYIKTYIAFGLNFDTLINLNKLQKDIEKCNEIIIKTKELFDEIDIFSAEIKRILEEKNFSKEEKFKKEDKKNLVIIEHRRWCIEKYYDGWQQGKERKDRYKIHPDLKDWRKLSDQSKANNLGSIDVLIDTIKKHYNNENIQTTTA